MRIPRNRARKAWRVHIKGALLPRSESKCHAVSCCHVASPTRRSNVHLRGWKAQTRHIQGPEPRRPDVPRGRRVFEGVVLSTRRSSFPSRRIGNLDVLTGPRMINVSDAFTVGISSVRVRIQHQKGAHDWHLRSLKSMVTNVFERLGARPGAESQINSATDQQGWHSCGSGVWSQLRRSRRRGGS